MQSLAPYFSDELGNQDQQIVALLATNSIDFIVTYLAVLHAGHIVMPIDPVYKKLEIDAIIERVGPAMIILQRRYIDQIGEHKVPTILSEDLPKSSVARNTKALRLPPDQQIASITFTSGTSGTPKAVPNTHANHIWSVEVCSKVWDWGHRDSLLVCLPLSHWYGLVMGLSGALYHGNSLYLRQQSFDARAVLTDLSSGKISIFTHGPIAYSKMIDEPGDYDLSVTRLLISGSAPFPPKLWQNFKDRFGAEVIETYGSSETGRIAANTPTDILLGSPGRILPGVEAKLGPGNELLVKSAGLFPGYWKIDKATKQATTPDGFWRTGDIAEIINEHIILKGRSQETIRKFGYTVSPRDVEWALLENPKIKEVLVVGKQIPGESDDEIYYYLAGEITEAELANYTKTSLPFSWRPDHIKIMPALPRTRTGKPDIKALKELSS